LCNFERNLDILNNYWCTFSEKNHKYYLEIGIVHNKKASAIISQIRLLDTKRLVNKIGTLNKEKFEEIKKAVKDLI